MNQPPGYGFPSAEGASPQNPSTLDPSSLEPGAFGIRAAAHLIDYLTCFLVGVVAGAASGLVVAILSFVVHLPAGWERRLGQTGPGIYVAVVVAQVAYHMLSEGLGGASLGKTICGLRVLSEDGAPCTLKKALVRSLAFYVDVLFFGLVGKQAMDSSRLRQRYGDRWGHTIVVKASSLPASLRSKPAVGILVGLLVHAVIVFAFMVSSAL